MPPEQEHTMDTNTATRTYHHLTTEELAQIRRQAVNSTTRSLPRTVTADPADVDDGDVTWARERLGVMIVLATAGTTFPAVL